LPGLLGPNITGGVFITHFDYIEQNNFFKISISIEVVFIKERGLVAL